MSCPLRMPLTPDSGTNAASQRLTGAASSVKASVQCSIQLSTSSHFLALKTGADDAENEGR